MIVRLNKNGNYWVARWTMPGGIRQSQSLGHCNIYTKRQAEKLCQEIAARLAVNPRHGQRAPTLSVWLDQLETSRSTTTSEGTQKLHAYTRRLLEQHLPDIPINTITRIMASKWRQDISNGREEETVRANISRAKVMFGEAVRLDLIPYNPFGREVSAPQTIEKNWAEIDTPTLKKILDACPHNYFRAAFALARWAGLRMNEMLSLAWADIDWQRSSITVRHEGRVTTKKRSRAIPMRPELAVELRHIYEQAATGSCGPCDGFPANNVYRLTKSILINAGVELYDKPYHTLRKNCETEWAGKHPITDVAHWLGNSPSVAAKHYVRPTAESVEKITGKSGTKLAQTNDLKEQNR